MQTSTLPPAAAAGTTADDRFDLHLRGVSKLYDGAPAVDALTLGARPGEFLFLLGPSGCGKTTTLRIVAGFVRPDRGEVVLRGRDVARVPAYKRNIGLVFQSYALFPHMTVAENVAYGLRMRGVKRDQVHARVGRALEVVQLGHLERRLPRQLSGGQQQRVALARAIVIEPEILLLDEPFSNLDQRLRQELRQEVRQLQRRLGITSVFVTHDQEEALAMADRIAVMHRGQLQQLGMPDELYERPTTTFVARFLGDCNFMPGKVEGGDARRATLRTDAGALAEGVPAAGLLAQPGARAVAMVRPERTEIAPLGASAPAANSVSGRVESIVYRGAQRRYIVRLDGDDATWLVDSPNAGVAAETLAEGSAVRLSWALEACRLVAEG